MTRIITNVAGRFGIKPKEAERFTKFLLVGTLGFIIDFGTLTFLVEVVKLPEIVASQTPFGEIAGLVLANTIAFSLAVLSNKPETTQFNLSPLPRLRSWTGFGGPGST